MEEYCFKESLLSIQFRKAFRGREQNNGTNMMASDLSETRPSKRLLSLLVKSFE